MILVFVMIAVFWGIGAATHAPRRDRWIMTLGLLGIVIASHLILPDGHPIRRNTGGSVELWLLITGCGVIVFIYSLGIGHLKKIMTKRDTSEFPDQAKLFSDTELERYADQIIVSDIGDTGQAALKNAKVLIVGAGGIQSSAGLYLASIGVGKIGLIDHAVVGAPDLQSQIIHTDDAIGQAKVHSAVDRIAGLNPYVDTCAYNRLFTKDIAVNLFFNYDVILAEITDLESIVTACDAAKTVGVPVVFGAMDGWYGRVSVFDPSVLETLPYDTYTNNTAAGIVSPVAGVVGSMMAAEAMKLITGAGRNLVGCTIIYNALQGDITHKTL